MRTVIYVQASDRRFYKNPVLKGDNWVLRFHSAAHCELFVRHGEDKDATRNLESAIQMLKEDGYYIERVDETINYADRYFNGTKLESAAICNVRPMSGPVPIRYMRTYGSVVDALVNDMPNTDIPVMVFPAIGAKGGCFFTQVTAS